MAKDSIFPYFQALLCSRMLVPEKNLGQQVSRLRTQSSCQL